MADLLFNSDNLSQYIYIVGKETLSELSQKVNVPVSLIISDNNLTGPLREGMALIIKSRQNVCRLCFEDFPLDDSVADRIKKDNRCDYLYPYQLVVFTKNC